MTTRARAMRIDLRTLVALNFLVAGCGNGDEGPAIVASPDHGSLFGNYDVTISGDLSKLGDISSVTVGGIHAYALRLDTDTITVTLQGAPKPGPAEVVIEGSHGKAVHHGVFTYDAPDTGAPLVWMAFGASLTQGFESDGLSQHSAINNVSGVIAKQADVYLGLPLFNDNVMPGLQPSDFALDCTTTKSQGDFLAEAISALTDPTTGLFNLTLGRVDPTLVPRNVAVGGSKVADIVEGSSGDIALIEHMVEEPTIAPNQALGMMDRSQVDRIEKLNPDVAFTVDLLGNDVDGAVLAPDDLHPEVITPLDDLQPLLTELAQRLGALHGQYFIANLPYLTVVPNVTLVGAARIAAGTDTAASWAAKVTQINDLIDGYNNALAATLAPYPNLHLVDFKGMLQAIVGPGVTYNGDHCTVAEFDGLFSLDNLHLTDTAYALLANSFIDAINQQLGTQIPHADLDAIHNADALAPAKLRADGFTCVPM
jgi:hypothetical protein